MLVLVRSKIENNLPVMQNFHLQKLFNCMLARCPKISIFGTPCFVVLIQYYLLFDSRMLQSNIFVVLSVGQLNNGKRPACFARTVCMRIGPFRTRDRAGARVRSFDLAKEARQMAKFARCSFAKTTANCSNSFCHFHLISSMSRLQRPLTFAYFNTVR